MEEQVVKAWEGAIERYGKEVVAEIYEHLLIKRSLSSNDAYKIARKHKLINGLTKSVNVAYVIRSGKFYVKIYNSSRNVFFIRVLEEDFDQFKEVLYK